MGIAMKLSYLLHFVLGLCVKWEKTDAAEGTTSQIVIPALAVARTVRNIIATIQPQR